MYYFLFNNTAGMFGFMYVDTFRRPAYLLKLSYLEIKMKKNGL